MATVYLSTTGSDSNTYSQAQSPSTPWATIAKCETSATSGDTISIADGTYTWSTQTFTKAFTFTAQNYGSVILDAAGAYVKWTMGAVVHTLNGLKFQNNYNAVTSSNYDMFKTSENITFNNCIFTDLVASAADTSSNVVAGGVILAAGSGKTITLNQCLIYNVNNDRTYAGASDKGGIFKSRVSNNFTLNNTSIYLNPSVSNDAFEYVFKGYQTSQGTQICTLKNTIIYNASAQTIGMGYGINQQTTTIAATYSNTYGTGLSTQTGTGNISSDPLFVDVASGDFRLRPTSPCIDTGSL